MLPQKIKEMLPQKIKEMLQQKIKEILPQMTRNAPTKVRTHRDSCGHRDTATL